MQVIVGAMRPIARGTGEDTMSAEIRAEKGGLSRRAVLAGAATMAAAPALAQECRLGPPPHEKGPRVFLDYDQIELDAAYDQSFYAPLAGQITKRYVSRSNEARARLGEPRRESYGPTAVEKLDIYRAKRPQAP